MPRLGVPVTTAPWEAPEDDDPLSHWFAGVGPHRRERWLRNPPHHDNLRLAPKHGLYQMDRDGRERCFSVPWGR